MINIQNYPGYIAIQTDSYQLEIHPLKQGVFRITTGRSYPSFAVEQLPESTDYQYTELEGNDLCRITTVDRVLILHRGRGVGGDLDYTLTGQEPYVLKGSLCSREEEGYTISTHLENDDSIYGLGEKVGTLDKRGRSWIMWNTDEFMHHPSADPLYQSMPLYHQYNGQRCATIFVDTVARSVFDMGDNDRSIARVAVYSRHLDYYLTVTPTLAEAVRTYALLTGTLPLPPLWALGYHQSRYSYFPDMRVQTLVAEFRKRKIPCDVIHLDIHYMKGFRVFTWDDTRFPDPNALAKKLEKEGIRLITIIDPGVKIDPDYAVYTEGIKEGLFCKNPDGTVYEGKVWPGPAVFPDFSRKKVRDWWSDWHREILRKGIAGIWNDMNEPSNFTNTRDPERSGPTVPADVIMENDDHPAPMAEYHNAYAITMNRATRDAFAKYLPNRRPFILTRAASPGIQRYAAVWTGDNASWWEHLSGGIPMMLNLGLSGSAFSGGDVGGFSQNATPELFARWMAASSLTPFFRGHSMVESKDHEPWSFGKRVEDICRKFISLRYQFLPYIYHIFEESTRTGDPIMRPLLYHYGRDPRCKLLQDQFLVGSNVLVAPVIHPGKETREVYLPQGEWYDFFTGEWHKGNVDLLVAAPLDHLPLFIRGGSIIPMEDTRQHTGEPRTAPLELRVYPDERGKAEGWLYDDQGEGFKYQQGEYCRMHFECENRQLKISRIGGSRAPSWKELSIRHLQHPEPPKSAKTVPFSSFEDAIIIDL